MHHHNLEMLNNYNNSFLWLICIPIWPTASIIEKTIKNKFLEEKPNNIKAKTGNMAPGIGILNMSPYISDIRFLLVKYLIQYISYKIIKTNAIINKKETSVKLIPQNKAKIETNTSPILSKASKILFSFCTYFS